MSLEEFNAWNENNLSLEACHQMNDGRWLLVFLDGTFTSFCLLP